MSTTDKSTLYYESDIIPIININDECGDHYNNYIIIPLPKEILVKANAQVKETVYPLDSRFMNFYNDETKKYSLPYLNNAAEYGRLYASFLKNVTLANLALNGSLKAWEIDRSIDVSKLFIQIVD